jgi:hypothetical protein
MHAIRSDIYYEVHMKIADVQYFRFAVYFSPITLWVKWCWSGVQYR